jgi:CheY-like chemotaxis protein
LHEDLKGRPGVILTDLEMPEIDGFEFLDEFSRFQKEIRDRYTIFALSSTQNSFLIHRVQEEPGFAGFISKPLTVKKFDDLLKQIVTR